MTMPLSSTRSKTSIRLEPAGALSIAITLSLKCWDLLRLPSRRLERHQTLFEAIKLLIQLIQLRVPRLAAAESRVRAPPVHPDLIRFVDRTDQQPVPAR